MPELPEVETTRRGLEPWVTNAEILSITVRNPSLRWPVPTQELLKLTGQRIDRIERRAKYLLVHLPSKVVLLHLGMSGSMRVLEPDETPRKHDHLDFLIRTHKNGNRVVRFNDPRRFGCCLVLSEPISEHSLLANLGPEPLTDDFDGAHLFALSRRRKLAVKNFIMDGKVVVGVGNIYASEALYEAGVRPGTAAGRVSRAKYDLLAGTIKEVLGKAIKAGGTTLNDFTQSDGSPGYFRHELQVYGRAGEACYRCESTIKSRTLGQRNTFYCTNCQT